MKNVFIYWVGDESKIAPMTDKLRSQGFNVVLGPSREENEYLMENFLYYKYSYEDRIWSFCSDVWRIYVLTKNTGIYIDATAMVGDNFAELYDEVMKHKTFFIRENLALIGSCLIGNSIPNNKIMIDMLEIMKDFKYRYTITHHILPFIITKYLIENYKATLSWDKFICDDVAIYELLFVRNENTYKKLGSASWSGVKHEAVDTWAPGEQNWHNRVVAKRIHNTIKDYLKMGYSEPWIWGVRRQYDKSTSKAERKELTRIYKNSTCRVRFDQRLIWSKLHSIFRNKFEKNKNN